MEEIKRDDEDNNKSFFLGGSSQLRKSPSSERISTWAGTDTQMHTDWAICELMELELLQLKMIIQEWVNSVRNREAWLKAHICSHLLKCSQSQWLQMTTIHDCDQFSSSKNLRTQLLKDLHTRVKYIVHL